MFDADYYIPWFKNLLKELENEGIQNSVIVLDNAKYHKTLHQREHFPKGSDSTAVLRKACEHYGLDCAEKETKAMLWRKLQAHKPSLPLEVEKLAKDKGHEVLWSPPHYSDLQPIERVWAVIQNAVGKAYTKDTKFADVKRRLVEQIEKLKDPSSDTVGGCIERANERLEELYKHLEKMMEIEVNGTTEGSNDGDGDAEDDCDLDHAAVGAAASDDDDAGDDSDNAGDDSDNAGDDSDDGAGDLDP